MLVLQKDRGDSDEAKLASLGVTGVNGAEVVVVPRGWRGGAPKKSKSKRKVSI